MNTFNKDTFTLFCDALGAKKCLQVFKCQCLCDEKNEAMIFPTCVTTENICSLVQLLSFDSSVSECVDILPIKQLHLKDLNLPSAVLEAVLGHFHRNCEKYTELESLLFGGTPFSVQAWKDVLQKKKKLIFQTFLLCRLFYPTVKQLEVSTCEMTDAATFSELLASNSVQKTLEYLTIDFVLCVCFFPSSLLFISYFCGNVAADDIGAIFDDQWTSLSDRQTSPEVPKMHLTLISPKVFAKTLFCEKTESTPYFFKIQIENIIPFFSYYYVLLQGYGLEELLFDCIEQLVEENSTLRVIKEVSIHGKLSRRLELTEINKLNKLSALSLKKFSWPVFQEENVFDALVASLQSRIECVVISNVITTTIIEKIATLLDELCTIEDWRLKSSFNFKDIFVI
ncbi:hypothetical protein RFI_14676 [Reticulomyxa filosa]|uniref:Uncharacterized protein n=1 Tax=Reticulomyxa filosa TaxID=46433 RepID=X6N8B6_RETFI|nr:hypothetical protein RFI_14676 [Reticulomyxa filosa]|eukprot:ETO22520.1 hypothetical protein RFI_14676 [Reticulomyxa filosa]